VLDDGLCVKSLNPSALKAFGCDEEEDIVGERVTEFLDGTSASRIEALTAELVRADPNNRCIWIPENLTVCKWDKSTFPAEASLSCFEFGSQCRYCLILRDIGDVIASERHIEELQRENRQLRESAKKLSGEMAIIGQCPAMKQLGRDIRRVGETDASVLIIGETGVGKELIARAIHALSSRSSIPMVCLNCAALPENLVESELFGHKKGAFTGATAEREGRFALADGGTLMLDEIGELPLNVQSKLLRTLQEGIYEPLGGDGPLTTDVRIIAATHRDLAEMVAEGMFREDLYFRLNVFPIEIPPLRDRGDDILLLANEFLSKLARQLGRRVHEFGPSDLAILKDYDWPGNVRELQNTIERALIISSTSEIDLAAAMALETDGQPPMKIFDHEAAIMTEVDIRGLKRSNIIRALQTSGARVSGAGGAAALLGMKPTTLNSRIKALQIAVPV
jgi:transcriptional regulator with GAF, ATPase, and Fis domain